METGHLHFFGEVRYAEDESCTADLPDSYRISVSAVMSKELLTTVPEEFCASLLERSEARGVHHVVVVLHDGELIGMVCACDLEEAQPRAIVRDVMGEPMFIGASQSLASAAETMLRFGIGALPVLDQTSCLIGIVTRSDLRTYGVLPNQRGVDRCASCGTGHRLAPRRGDEICFCRACLEAAHNSEDDEVTLGGGD